MFSSLAKYLFILAVIAFGIAFLLDRSLNNRFGGVNFIPVCEPVEIADGFTYHKNFKVDYQSDYDVKLECVRTMPLDQLENLLRNDLAGGYSIYENEVKIRTVDFKDDWYGSSTTNDTSARMFGGFPASTSKIYRIEFTVKKTIQELKPTLPNIVVALNSTVWKTKFYAPAIPYMLGRDALRLLGLLFLLFGIAAQIRHWIKRRSGKTAPC